MKKTITIITLGLLISLTSFATVRTVNNFVPNAAQYSDVQSAIQASAVGDTVQIHGTPINYGNIVLDRRLCLMGAGSNLNNTVNNFNTELGVIKIDTILAPIVYTISGFSIHGIKFSALDYQIVSGHPIGNKANDVIINKCNISILNIKGRNWVVKNCISNLISIDYSTSINSNIIIANNIILNNLSNGQSNVMYAPNVIATNNIFSGPNALQSCYNILYTNNIFLNTVSASNSGNIFNKNLTFTGTPNQVNLPLVNNTGTGNINNTNPGFINVPTPLSSTLGNPSPNWANYNYAFPTTSAAYNAGTDGTNLGITGGPYPWNGSSLDGRAQIPLMQELNIINSVINQGQPLNIQFKARKNN